MNYPRASSLACSPALAAAWRDSVNVGGVLPLTAGEVSGDGASPALIHVVGVFPFGGGSGLTKRGASGILQDAMRQKV